MERILETKLQMYMIAFRYTQICIPPPPPHLDCEDIDGTNFIVLENDPYGFDQDNDGIGCDDDSESEDGSNDNGDGGSDAGGVWCRWRWRWWRWRF